MHKCDRLVVGEWVRIRMYVCVFLHINVCLCIRLIQFVSHIKWNSLSIQFHWFVDEQLKLMKNVYKCRKVKFAVFVVVVSCETCFVKKKIWKSLRHWCNLIMHWDVSEEYFINMPKLVRQFQSLFNTVSIRNDIGERKSNGFESYIQIPHYLS